MLGVLVDFEQGFADAERAAEAVARSAGDVAKAAKAMQKAAQDGDIKRLRQGADAVGARVDTLRQEAANARTAWPYSDEEEVDYLQDGYVQEFLRIAAASRLKAQERDDRILAFPSIIRVLPTSRAVKIDRKVVPGVRPSRLAAILLSKQNEKPKAKSEQFLEALYRAYKVLCPKEHAGNPVKLSAVYEAFTLQPGAAAEYGKSEFARDVFLLDRSRIERTKSGARWSLPLGGSAKGAEKDKFTFVAQDGEVVTYWGLQFREDEP